MTTWRYNKDGENKDTYTPRKHQAEQSMWRSFGLITLPNTIEDEQNRPSIMTWLDNISESIDDFDLNIEACSMKDDGNATSWVPTDEIHDSMRINDLVVTDSTDKGWLIRINEAIDHTKNIIGSTYRSFLNDIREIRNLPPKHQFVSRGVEELYDAVDQPFREWLSSIKTTDSKSDRIAEWYNDLDNIVNKKAEEILGSAGYRDYIGIEDEKQGNKTKNIITAYNSFKYFLNKK